MHQQSDAASHAIAAISALNEWYDEASGLWDTTGWWNSANALTALADFSALDPALDHVIRHIFGNTFKQAQKANVKVYKLMTQEKVESYAWISPSRDDGNESMMGFPGFVNEYYDDEGWWALAWLKVYDITNQTKYLTSAISIFSDMTTGWGAPCGGLWWNKDHTYTGAIENELFFAVASQLANRVPLSQKHYYLDWALREWQWFEGTGMINADFNINNGIDFKTCRNDNGVIWTYNQGVILGGLLELHKAAPNASYIVIAENIAHAAIDRLSDSGGILHEPCEPNCGADGPQFKGIFMRNLQILQRTHPHGKIQEFIERNAMSIWANDRDDRDQMGLIWSGPYTAATASTQSSACDALIAAMNTNHANQSIHTTE